jgi:alkanesulfonate monooxygenase SsuD/methylene tetrahydromethanopterin reductase-like flavin-dependent oxidoreductase (luciferase family)
VDIGVTLGDMPVGVSPARHFDSILRQVEAAQRNGVKYFFIGHHVAFEGARWLQPVPLLARLAAELDADARLATHVLIGPLYHPVPFAEELATLDIVTEGRLIVGVGLGYLRREYELLGLDFDSRADRLEELLSVVRGLWTGAPVHFHGTFFDLEGVSTPVVPVQVPHPPIWVGGQTLGAVRRSARIGDGWPITSNIDVTEMIRRVKIYADERRRLGKAVTCLPLRREIFPGPHNRRRRGDRCPGDEDMVPRHVVSRQRRDGSRDHCP